MLLGPFTKIIILFYELYPILSNYFFSFFGFRKTKKNISIKNISFMYYTCILICIYKLYEYLKKNIYEIANNLKCKDREFGIVYLFILGSPQSCLFLSTIYYVLKILFIFIHILSFSVIIITY